MLRTRLQPPKKALPEQPVCSAQLRITQAGWRIRLLWSPPTSHPSAVLWPIPMWGTNNTVWNIWSPFPFAPASPLCLAWLWPLCLFAPLCFSRHPETPQLQCRRTGTSRFSNTCETLFVIFHSVLFQSSLAKVKLVDYTKRNNGIIL